MGAGVSVYSATSKKGGAAAGGGAGGLPTTPYKFQPISNVSYNAGQGASDLNSMFPSLAKYAAASTAYQTQQREKIMPGASKQLGLASKDLQSFLSGQVPQDVVDFTQRQVAQRNGGGFNPFTGGGGAPEDFARSIGRLSTDFTQAGLSAAPTWLQLADSFVTKTNDAASLAIGLNDIRYKYDALNTGIDQFNSSGGATQYATNYQNQANQTIYGQNQANQQSAQLGQTAGAVTNALGSLYGVYKSTQGAPITSTPAYGNTTPIYEGTMNNQPVVRPVQVGYPAATYNGGAAPRV